MLMSSLIPSQDKTGTVITSFANQIATQESFRLNTEIDSTTGHLMMASASAVDPSSRVDVSMLAAAAESYKISSDIRDYVIAEVPIVEGDIPNRNMHCFLTSRLVEFIPEYGTQCFKTFVGKPVFYEHEHNDHTKAKGIILDAQMREVNGRWFVFILKAFDRTKDRKLAEDVLSGRRKGHSMSAWANKFNCSLCGHLWDTSYEKSCDCAKGQMNVRRPNVYAGFGDIVDDKLVYGVPKGITFFESSSVGVPANNGAIQVSERTLK